jgi:hypothetical protein
VQQHFEVAHGSDGDGVRGGVQVDDLTVTRGEEMVAQGVN